jgi:hypothetical protein
MARSDIARFAGLAACIAACSSPPSRPAEESLSLSTLRQACEQGKLAACDWLGKREVEQGDLAAAVETYRKACTDDMPVACLNLLKLAAPDSRLSSEQRHIALASLCEKGVLQGCETLVALAANDPSAQEKKQGVLWLKTACDQIGDSAACARLGEVYDTAAFAGVRVLDARDPGAAVDLYTKACGRAFNRNFWDDTPSHVDATSSSHAEEASCEKLGDHFVSGDGVPVNLLIAVDAYRHGGKIFSSACIQKQTKIRQADPSVAAYDDQQSAKEEQDHAQRLAAHEQDVADEAAQAKEEAEEAKQAAEEKEAQAEAQAAQQSDATTQFAQGLVAQANASNQYLPPPKANFSQTPRTTKIPKQTASSGAPKPSYSSSHPATRNTASSVQHPYVYVPGPNPGGLPGGAPSSYRTTVPSKPVQGGNSTNPSGSGPAGPAPAPTGNSALLQQCLARPITKTHLVQTNKFLAHSQIFQLLLDKVQVTCAPPNSKTWADWDACLGDNATRAYWSEEDAAQDDNDDLMHRYSAVASYYQGSEVCLNGPIRGTRKDCVTQAGTLEVVIGVCVPRLKSDIAQMNCEYSMLPGVWAAEDAQRDDNARKKRDDDCHQQFGY